MDALSAKPIDDTPFATVPKSLTILADAMLELWEMAQQPLLLAFDWWAASADARWRGLVPAAEHQIAAEHHNELIVPDVLEEDGEHALFA